LEIELMGLVRISANYVMYTGVVLVRKSMIYVLDLDHSHFLNLGFV